MDLQEFVDDVVRDFPDALESVARRAVVRAVIAFFRDSNAWRHDETFALVQGTKEVFLSLPFDTVMAASATAVYIDEQGNRRKLTAATKDDLHINTTGKPRSFHADRIAFQIDGDGSPGQLEIEAILVPTRSVTEIPDEIGEIWYEDIREGVAAYMYMMPGQNWYDARRAGQHAALFDDAILKAKRMARGDRNKPRRVAKFNPGFTW